MKTSLVLVLVLFGISARAETPTPSLAPPSDPAAPISPAAPAPAVSPAVPAPSPTPDATVAPSPASAITPTSPNLPAPGFAPTRYEALWTKSPFAVATSESVGEESPDYFLVGVANQDGVFYASVIERQNQEHFLLTSDKPMRGLTLKSINRNRDGDTFAEVMKDGQPLTLKMEQAPAGPANTPMAGGMMPPGVIMTPQIPIPAGANGGYPGANGSFRPARFHRPPIRLPPGQGQIGGQTGTPTPAPANSPNPTPPPPPQ